MTRGIHEPADVVMEGGTIDGKKAMRALLTATLPEEDCEAYGIECGACYIEALCLALWHRALNGDVQAARLVFDLANVVSPGEGDGYEDELSIALRKLGEALEKKEAV